MISKRLLKNLAHSTYMNTSWILDKEKTADHHANLQISESIGRLYKNLRDSLFFYNSHANPAKQIKLWPPEQTTLESFSSFMLLLGSCKAILQHENKSIHLGIYQMNGFEEDCQLELILNADFDNLADLSWRDQSLRAYTEEIIAKLVLKELVKAWSLMQNETNAGAEKNGNIL